MKPARSHDTIQNPAARIQRLVLAMGAAGLLVFDGASCAAPADSNPAPASAAASMEPRLEAPIGHRQPNAEDVPAGVLHDEVTISQNQRDLDKELDICRGC
jgi:hypothetical protein